MERKRSKERLVSPEEVKAAADRAEGIAPPEPAKPDPLNPPETRGRPSSFLPEYVDIARKLCESGRTDEEIADLLGVSQRTLYRWQAKYPEFCQAMSAGKNIPDTRVERSLYLRAIGYTYEAEKVTKSGDIVTYKVHVPPDPVAQKFWLMNRCSDRWRERKENVIGTPDAFKQMDDEQLIASLQHDLVEFGPELLQLLPPDGKKGKTKGNGTQH